MEKEQPEIHLQQKEIKPSDSIENAHAAGDGAMIKNDETLPDCNDQNEKAVTKKDEVY